MVLGITEPLIFRCFMAWKFNPFTGTFDFYNKNLDGIPIGDDDTRFRWVAPDTLQLLVNGSIRQSWTTEIASGTTGSPMGLLLSLTYA